MNKKSGHIRSVLSPLTILAIVFISSPLCSQPWYVSTTGSDSNSGTITSPYATIQKAVSVVQPGQTIYVRGGTYTLTTTISISKSGNENNIIALSSYQGERAVLDFSQQTLSSANRGIVLSGSYWHIKGMDVSGAGDNGMVISGGSNNTVENCAFYRNRDSGLQIDNGASNNTIKNCDSYYNADPPDYGDADGFAPKLTVGSGNYFYGCRSWRNCDDGWDGYLRGADDVSTVLENCWTFDNGYLEDGTDPGAAANGNGFKMGGSDDKTLKHNFTLRRCLSFKNKAKGFDQNNNKGTMILYNCTGNANLSYDYSINQTLADGKELVIKNCVVLGTSSIGTFAIQDKNSWLPPFSVTASDFITIDPASAYGARKADGSLPDISYMHLAASSQLIDAGVDVGLPFAGTAPDLGCFETNMTAIETIRYDETLTCYPNPARDIMMLTFEMPDNGKCTVALYDVTGRFIRTLFDAEAEEGTFIHDFNVSDLPSGIYLIRITVNKTGLAAGRLIRL